jgi:hypothetical protein
MSITFQRARTVAVGEKPSSADYNTLAKAFNDRLLSGVADGAWRIVWYMLALVRQPRNPKAVALGAYEWPPVDEWLKFYGLIDPLRMPGVSWPAAPPGEEEGINLSWPLGAFVFGTAATDLDAENTRLDVVPLLVGGAAPVSPGDYWALGQAQRGAIDLAADIQSSPVMTASQEHYKIGYHGIVPYLKSYGGFFPTRLSLGDCGDETPDFPATPMWQVFFTQVGSDPQVRKYYSGFCPNAGSPGVTSPPATPIWGILYGRFNYKIYRWDGTVEELATNEWIEGPYTGGGYLQRESNEQMEQSMNNLLVSYRGSLEQRSVDFKIKNVGFDYEAFMNRPYALAPARAVWDGESLLTEYPRYEFVGAGAHAAGAYVPHGGGHHQIGVGYVFAGFYAQASGLSGPVTVEVLAVDGGGSKRVGEFELSPDTPEVLHYFAAAPLGLGGGVPQVRFRLVTAVEIDAEGWLMIDIAELQDYRPWVNDAYLMLRMGSTSGGDAFGQSDGLDNHGMIYDEAKRISDEYVNNGVISNPYAGGLPDQSGLAGAPIVDNPVYESARQFVVNHVRLANRERLVGYEVVNGKSVLHFERNAVVDGEKLDLFRGIGPDALPVNGPGPLADGVRPTIAGGVEYEVKGGVEVSYNGGTVAAGARFTGVAGVETYDAAPGSTGAEQVFETEGIRQTAPPGGSSNRWACFLTFNVYHTSESSIWKPDNYGDALVTLTQRCHLGSVDIRKDRVLLGHFSHGQKPVLISEAPPGYIYAKGTHRPGRYETEENAVKYYKSCQVYAAPYEVESAVDYVDGSKHYVKVTLKTRLRGATSAPATVARDPLTWTTLNEQEFRADENGVMEYLRYKATGQNCRRGVIGDTAMENEIWGMPDDPFGGCFPRVWFTKLVPEAHADTPVEDSIVQSTDSRMTVDAFVQMEVYLRAMCEGYIDEATSQNYGCAGNLSAFYDYTFSNLMLEATENKWLAYLPQVNRPDLPRGHSILPNTKIWAEVYNQYAQAVNLLNRARIDLPMETEHRVLHYDKLQVVTPLTAEPADPSGPCAGDSLLGNGDYATVKVATQQGAVAVAEDWQDGINFIISHSSQFHLSGSKSAIACVGGDGVWALDVAYSTVEYRLKEDQIQMNAIPAELLSTLQEGGVGMIGWVNRRRVWYTQNDVDGEPAQCCTAENCSSSFLADGSQGVTIQYDLHEENEIRCELLPRSGGFTPPAISPSYHWAWRCGSSGAFYQHTSGGPFTQAVFTPSGDAGLYVTIPIVG